MDLAPFTAEHPSLPFGRTHGWLAESGEFVARREGSAWLFDVWASVEAFTTLRGASSALVAGNLSSLAETSATIAGLHEGA